MARRHVRTVGRLLGLATLLLLAFSSQAGAATFIVNNGGDGHDRDTLDAVCDAAPSGETPFCTLRAAVEQADAVDDEDLISVQVSDVALTLAGGGAIEIDKDLTIQGLSADSTAIFQQLSPGSGDRVFDIAAGAKVTLDALTIRAGEAHSGNNYFGGNIRSAGTLTIRDSSITDGVGDSAGGVANVGGSLTIERSTFTRNVAPSSPFEGGDAGAILNFGTATPATLTIESSTISGNDARLGGAIFSTNNAKNSITIANSTIAFNDSGDRGGGGGLLVASGTAAVRNTILAKNTSTSGGQNCSADEGATISSNGHNLESGTDCGFASITDRQNADPLLESLGFNGGATQTHGLGPGSPAIDTGAPGCPVVDQRGVSRPQGPSCDIGAFELPQSIVVPPDQTPPETTIVSGPTGPTADRTPTFVFSASEPGSRFECSVDEGPFQQCTSPFTTAPLPPGRHTLAVRAMDAAGNVDATPSAAEFVIEELTVADLPAPGLGEEVNIGPVGDGPVLIAVPAGTATAGARASQKGLTFVPLTEARQVPVGSFLDTRRGTVRLQSARDRRGTRQTGTFLNSLFQVRQSRKLSAKGRTDLVLKGGGFRRCRTVGKGKPSAALSRRTVRRLRANANGNFRTGGRNSSATVRGTIWDIADRCDGTLTRVRRGRVVVRDFRRKRNIVLPAGKSYLARAPG